MVDHIEKDLSTSEPYFFLKIIGFASSKLFIKGKSEKKIIGKSFYLEPEVIKENYNEKSDIWSVGVILYMLIVKKPPFDEVPESKYMKKLQKLGIISTDINCLIFLMK